MMRVVTLRRDSIRVNRQSCPRASRAGFTLIELVTVMIAATVLLASLASTVIMSTRLLEAPPEKSQQWHDQEIADRLAADLRYATNIDETLTYGFEITRPNATTGVPESAEYEAYIDGLTRQIDSGPVIPLDVDSPSHSFSVDGYTAPTYTVSSNVPRVRSYNSVGTVWATDTLIIDLPAGCKDGDLLVCVVAARSPWFLFAPSDWNFLHYLYPGNLRMRVMYKTYNSLTATPVVINAFPAGGMSASIVAIENVDPTYPIPWTATASGTATHGSPNTYPSPLQPSDIAPNQLSLQLFAGAGDPWYDGGLGMASFTDVLQQEGAANSQTYGNAIAISARTGEIPDLSIRPRPLHIAGGVWAQVGMTIGAAP